MFKYDKLNFTFQKLRNKEGLNLILAWVLVLVFALYLIQTLTPLRINGDAMRLLDMASSAATTGEYFAFGKEDLFPKLYPFIIDQLLHSEIATSFHLVFLNFTFLI